MGRNAHSLRCAVATVFACIGLWPGLIQAAWIEWRANAQTNVIGYRVYSGDTTRAYNSVVDLGSQIRFQVPSLAPGKAYFFAITAYDTDGLESDFSDEVLLTGVQNNLPPIAISDQYATAKDTSLQVVSANGVLANDYDPDGDAISPFISSFPSHGQLTLNSAGGFLYLPQTGFAGEDSFTYRVSDGTATSELATVSIIIFNSMAINRAPVANGERYGVLKNSLLNVDPSAGVLANDSDEDGNIIVPVLMSLPAHGGLAMYNTGGFQYQPAVDFTGTDSFTYKVSDGTLESAIATVLIVVSNTSSSTNTIPTSNHPPVATGDIFRTERNQILDIGPSAGVLANDFDVDGDSLTASLVSLPAHGEIIMDSNGGFRFTPSTTFVGSDSFSYRASDGLAFSAIVNVVIDIAESSHVDPVTCADCMAELNSFVAAHSARVSAAAIATVASNSLDEVVRAFAQVAKALRSDDPVVNGKLFSIAHCLLTVVSNAIDVRSDVVEKMYPSQWSSAASKLLPTLEQSTAGVGDSKEAARVLATAAKNLKRLDTYIVRSQVVPDTLQNRSLSFALSGSSGLPFTASFGTGTFTAQVAGGAVLAGTYTFNQTAWDQGTLVLNFASAPPASYQLQFRSPRGRILGPLVKGSFRVVQ